MATITLEVPNEIANKIKPHSIVRFKQFLTLNREYELNKLDGNGWKKIVDFGDGIEAKKIVDFLANNKYFLYGLSLAKTNY